LSDLSDFSLFYQTFLTTRVRKKFGELLKNRTNRTNPNPVFEEVRPMSTPSILDLTDLGARINESHHLALKHADKAIEHAIACGQMLLEAKAKVPHGKWLPWLRDNITFGERSAQGYMRIAQRVPPQIRNGVADFPSLRTALHALAAPRRGFREAMDADLKVWIEHNRALKAMRPDKAEDMSIEDVKALCDSIRAYDEIMHRHGVCPWEGTEDEDCCSVCTPYHAEEGR
jgi:hypothetical protein